jgi:hypothetical protein
MTDEGMLSPRTLRNNRAARRLLRYGAVLIDPLPQEEPTPSPEEPEPPLDVSTLHLAEIRYAVFLQSSVDLHTQAARLNRPIPEEIEELIRMTPLQLRTRLAAMGHVGFEQLVQLVQATQARFQLEGSRSDATWESAGAWSTSPARMLNTRCQSFPYQYYSLGDPGRNTGENTPAQRPPIPWSEELQQLQQGILEVTPPSLSDAATIPPVDSGDSQSPIQAIVTTPTVLYVSPGVTIIYLQ